MEKMVKKLLSVAIALAMVISWLPGTVFQADAAANEDLCACGCGAAADAVQWQALTAGTLDQAGHYYLSADLALTGTLQVSAAVTLDLRGKDITPAAATRTIYVNSGASLTILDTVGGGEIYGADVSGNAEYGGAINVAQNAELTMLSGVVRDGKAVRGGNIAAYGDVTIGGKARVIGGSAERGGNFFITAGTTTITGYAKILEGVASSMAGNLYVTATTATLKIAGRATVAGGNCNGSANIASMYGNVIITDNAVVDAGATGSDTSVQVTGTATEKSGTLTVSGGTVYGKLAVTSYVSSVKISGAPVIKHLYMDNKGVSKRIDPTGMTDGASVTVEAVDAAITDTLTGAANYLPYFHAYTSGQMVIVSGNALQLSAGCPCGCGAENPTWTTWSGGAISASGHYRLSGAKTLSGTITIGDGTEENALNVVIDLNGNALTAASAARAFEVSAYSTLTIVDAAGSGSVTGASVTENGGTILVNNYATFNLRSGTITGGETTGYGGNIYSSGTVNIYDGTVSNGIAGRGGNIKSTGTVNIYNGTITGGKASSNGGNLCNDGILRIYNGTVNAPSSTYNIFSTDENNMVYICGGKVSGGTIRTYGSNLYISGGEVGCTIECGEYKTTFGHDKSRLVISGGTITGNITVSGSTYLPEVSISGGTMGTVKITEALLVSLSGAPSIQSLTLGNVESASLGQIPADATFPDAVAQGQSGNVKWVLLSGGVLLLSGNGAMTNYGYNEAPWDAYKTQITAAIIGNGITSIGNSAFYECSALTQVHIPEGVTSIGTWAFHETSALKHITFPVSLQSIGSFTFRSYCYLTSAAYRGTESQWSAVNVGNNTALTNLVSNGAFTYLAGTDNNTATIQRPVNRTSWSVSGNTLTINGIGAMPNYYHDTGLTKYTGAPWSDYAEEITTVVIESGVTTVGTWAFYGLKNLTSVTIPSTVDEIGNSAFRDCSKLQTVSITGVKKIGTNAFQGCTALTTVTGSSALTQICDGAFSGCEALTGLTGASAIDTLGIKAFDGCEALTAFGNWFSSDYAVVDGVLYSSDKATLLQVPGGYTGSFTVPSGVTTIGAYAFSNCEKVTEINVSDSVTTIDAAAFDGCTAVQTISLGAGVSTVGINAFSNCDSQQAFVVSANNKNLSYDKASGALLSYGKTALRHAPGGVEDFTVPASVTAVNYYAFYANNTVKTVTLSDKTTAIGGLAFAATGNLKEINVPAGMTSVGKAAFEASGVTDVNYPGTLATYNAISVAAYNEPLLSAKVHCTLMDTTSCGDGVTAILDTDGLLTITGTGSITTAPWSAYADQITTLNLSSGITAIGDNVFAGCTGLTEVIYDGTQVQWERLPKGTGNEVLESASVGGFTAAVPVGIVVTKLPDKVDYMVGDTVDPTGMEVSIVYNDETTSLANLADCVIGEPTMPGKTEVTVTYGDFTTTMQLNVSASGTSGEVNWTLDADGKLTISGTGAMDYNSVAWSAYMAQITSVEIQEGVTSRLPNGAFRNAVNLQSVSLPEGITWISATAFYGCTSLTEIVLPASITSIRDSAFSGCTNLKKITIGEDVGSIAANAFNNCGSLTDIYFGGDMTQWDAYGVTLADTVTIHYAKKNLVGVDVTWTQEAKAEYYMTEELDLTGMVVTLVYDDESTEETTDYTAAYDFTVAGTQTVEIKHQGNTVYSYEVTVLPAGVSEDGLSWRIDAEGLLTILAVVEEGEEDAVMTDYTEEAPAPWAAYAESITAVVIDGNIANVGTNAFANCINLTAISLTKSVTAIGDNAFAGCTALVEVTYSGLVSDWEAITVGEGNESLTQANITCQILYGDANGDGAVNCQDTLLIMKYLAGWDVEIDLISADVTGDGRVNTQDSLRIMKYMAAWDVVLGPQA